MIAQIQRLEAVIQAILGTRPFDLLAQSPEILAAIDAAITQISLSLEQHPEWISAAAPSGQSTGQPAPSGGSQTALSGTAQDTVTTNVDLEGLN